jgi:hypothetical protein
MPALPLEPLNEETQVFRLICCGVALLGVISAEGTAASAGGRIEQVKRGFAQGLAIFESARSQGIWPIIKDEPEPPPEP